jgi:hypothetical protein
MPANTASTDPGDDQPVLVCPYVPGRLDPDTWLAVIHSKLRYRLVEMPAWDEYAYGRLVRRLWAGGMTFIIVEHDVVPTADQLAEIAACGHDWCYYDYDTDLYPRGPMFGLVRFSGRLTREHPHAAEVALITGSRKDQEVEWWRVDSMMARDLTIRLGPDSWHVHTPPVAHRHPGPPSGPP